ncbi:unnamed protein product [Coregonus sp. 'balchen']|nr:unnamed protein product [Coregonus sp. 'balchen']
MQQVLDNLRDLPPTTGAKDTDLLFLRGIIESPIVRSLAKRLEDVKLEAVRDNNQQLISEILDSITGLSGRDASAEELANILQEPHFKGVTFRVDRGELVIARILHGSLIDRQGMLHAGDVIREVNGREVGSDPKELLELLRDCQGGITLKILPSYRDTPAPPQVHLKPHFNYSPATDNLIPCKEAGLAFSKGDVLHIVNREDPNWWQAVNIVGGATGLIPSQFLEEKRKAFVRREWNGSGVLCGTLTGKKKKKKMMYMMSKNAEFDRHELQIYEEVAKMPPFQRKTLVLIGAQGVGRRSLKNRLIIINPLLYGTTVPFTSRPAREEERDGQSYCFVSRSQMEADIKASRYLEHGEYDGNLYGTKMNSIHEVVDAGRTCILDVNPQALKQLKTAEFMPFVVFIAAPELDILRAMHKAVVDAGLTTKLLTLGVLRDSCPVPTCCPAWLGCSLLGWRTHRTLLGPGAHGD